MDNPETLNEEGALAILADALDRCEKEDMRAPAIFAALDYLAARANLQWPFENFRRALNYRPDESMSTSPSSRWGCLPTLRPPTR